VRRLSTRLPTSMIISIEVGKVRKQEMCRRKRSIEVGEMKKLVMYRNKRSEKGEITRGNQVQRSCIVFEEKIVQKNSHYRLHDTKLYSAFHRKLLSIL
jgi:hypothetical protein